MIKEMQTLRLRNNMLLLLLLLLSSALLEFSSAVEEVRHVKVLTKNGVVQGFQKTVQNRNVYHFLGIPFAKPPIGQLRFRHPEPITSWEGVKDATRYPPTCFQSFPEYRQYMNPVSRMWLNNTPMSEDCLYLNVWTDQLPPLNSQSRKRPVMVWIYGGGFTSGTSTLEVYNGAILSAMMNVVVVSMQYRVGPFGFLYLGIPEMPGNQGMMDQVMALEWVKENIERFGGDPKRVTLFGESAGAASVSLHLLSNCSRPLFQQAIMQSATALAWWSYEGPNTAERKAFLLAQISGCHVSDVQPDRKWAVAECLRSLDAQTFVVNQWEISFAEPTTSRAKKLFNYFQGKHQGNVINTAAMYFVVPFKPVIAAPFLKEPPKNAMLPGRFSRDHRVMLGVNKDEGVYFLIEGMRQFFMPNMEGVFLPEEFRYGGSVLDPGDMVSLYIMDEDYLHSFLVQATIFHYEIPSRAFGWRDWSANELVDALDDLTGDYNFKCPVVDFANMYASDKNAQVFMYSFERRTSNMTWPSWTGVMHGYEIEYVFGMPFNDKFQKEFYSFNEEERKLSEQMMRFWTNFAATGSPNNHPGEFHTRNKDNFWERYEIPPGAGEGSNWNDEDIYQSGPYYEKDDFSKYRRHLVFDTELRVERNLRRKDCLFWSSHLLKLQKKVVKEYQNYPEVCK